MFTNPYFFMRELMCSSPLETELEIEGAALLVDTEVTLEALLVSKVVLPMLLVAIVLSSSL